MKPKTDFCAAQYMDRTSGWRNAIFGAIKDVHGKWSDKTTMPAFLYWWVKYRWDNRIHGIKPMNDELKAAGWPIVKRRSVCGKCNGTGKTQDKCEVCGGTGIFSMYGGVNKVCYGCKGDKSFREPCGWPCSKGNLEYWDFDGVKPVITEEW